MQFNLHFFKPTTTITKTTWNRRILVSAAYLSFEEIYIAIDFDIEFTYRMYLCGCIADSIVHAMSGVREQIWTIQKDLRGPSNEANVEINQETY